MMINTFSQKTQDIDLAFIDQSQLDEMSLQEKRWAENQFRIIYAQQMAKTYAKMQNENRIKRNLLNIEKQKEKQTEKLIQKIEGYQQKRKKRFSQKLQSYKSNEDKWVKKMQSIESKFRHQNREAIQKAQKYRQESQIFWKNKQQQITTSREKGFKKFSLNRTQLNLGNSETDLLLILNDKKIQNSNPKKLNFDSLYQIDSRSRMKSDRSRDTLQSSRAVDIDGQISKHQQRSIMIQKEKQKIIFQKAMERLAKIQLSRKKAQKLKQSSISPVQVRKPKKQRTEQNVDSHPYQHKTKSFHGSKSKDALNDESIKNHIKAKKLLQQQQFKQRDKILQHNLQKIRKDKILRAIKNKVHDIKKQAIKMQSYQ